jgi:hypothetical protein
LIQCEADIAAVGDWNYCADRIGGNLDIEMHIPDHTLLSFRAGSCKTKIRSPFLPEDLRSGTWNALTCDIRILWKACGKSVSNAIHYWVIIRHHRYRAIGVNHLEGVWSHSTLNWARSDRPLVLPGTSLYQEGLFVRLRLHTGARSGLPGGRLPVLSAVFPGGLPLALRPPDRCPQHWRDANLGRRRVRVVALTAMTLSRGLNAVFALFGRRLRITDPTSHGGQAAQAGAATQRLI